MAKSDSDSNPMKCYNTSVNTDVTPTATVTIDSHSYNHQVVQTRCQNCPGINADAPKIEKGWCPIEAATGK